MASFKYQKSALIAMSALHKDAQFFSQSNCNILGVILRYSWSTVSGAHFSYIHDRVYSLNS